MITSRNNNVVRWLYALGTRKGRRDEGLTIAEGFNLCLEAFASRARVVKLVLSESMMNRPECNELRQAASDFDSEVEVIELADGCYEKISGLKNPDGAAVVLDLPETSLANVLGEDCKLVVGAGVQEPGNAGAIVRVAEAAGASGCIFLDGVDVSSPKFIRAAMGSSFRVPCACADAETFLTGAQEAGVRILAADGGSEQLRAVDYAQVSYKSPVAICLGSEGQGVPDEVLAAAEKCVVIPMAGKTESLNVSVAAGILLYEARKYWTE